MADRLDALTVREYNGKSYWTKIGAAFPGKSGGWIVRLDAVPASADGQYTIHLREPLPRDGQRQGNQSNATNDRGGGAWGGDLDDNIPY
jgi:hypothetical protein